MTLIDIGGDTALDTAILGDEGAQPLLMICGTSQSYKLWLTMAEALAGNGHRVICYDHRGMGDSTRGGAPITMDSLAADADALLGALGVDKAHVLGWSLGSAVAQELAIAHPERVAGLVLYGTWEHIDPHQGTVLSVLRTSWDSGSMELALGALALAFSPELVNSDAFATLMSGALPTFPQTEGQIKATSEQWEADLLHDTRGRLQSITSPTLVVAGEHDLLTPPRRCQAVADTIAGARIETFTGPGSSHALAFERPDEFVLLVLESLGEHKIA